MSVPPPSKSDSLPTSTVELAVKCTHLKNKDTMSKSDPFCVVKQKISGDQWFEWGRTEVIEDNLNPEWINKIKVKYSFEERQTLKFEVYDHDKKTTKLEKQTLMGQITVTLGALVSAKVYKGQFEKKSGEILIVADEVSENDTDKVSFTFSGQHLDKKDTFGKSDPFFIIYKAVTSKEWIKVYESEWIKNTLDPTWKKCTLSLRELCDGNQDLPLKIEVFDYDSNKKHDLIGIVETSVSRLSSSKTLDIINPSKKDKKKYVNSGVLKIDSFDLTVTPTFVGYMQSGTILNFSVAVDFTASNGNIYSPISLHRRDSHGENEYTTAIKAIGEVIEDYDSDRQFPAFGFGAKVPPRKEVSHEFPLNFQADPYCNGIAGILQAYDQCVKEIEFYGPTNFSPVIERLIKIATAHQNGSHYFVLLILTDGAITDLDKTKGAIVRASHLPISIVIVGVGGADFTSMEELDSDKALLTDPADGSKALRDIVQFVEMKKFLIRDGKGGVQWNKEDLSKQVLAEVPNQFLGWMNQRGVKPLKA